MSFNPCGRMQGLREQKRRPIILEVLLHPCLHFLYDPVDDLDILDILLHDVQVSCCDIVCEGNTHLGVWTIPMSRRVQPEQMQKEHCMPRA